MVEAQKVLLLTCLIEFIFLSKQLKWNLARASFVILVPTFGLSAWPLPFTPISSSFWFLDNPVLCKIFYTYSWALTFWFASLIRNHYEDAEHGRKSRVIMRQRTEGGQPGNVSCHLCQSRNNKLFVFRALQ